jgi:hypothetical protein
MPPNSVLRGTKLIGNSIPKRSVMFAGIPCGVRIPPLPGSPRTEDSTGAESPQVRSG